MIARSSLIRIVRGARNSATMFALRPRLAATILAVLPAGLVATMSPRAAADEEKPAASAGSAALFERLDANRDKVIKSDEVTEENRRLFDRLVRRGDGNRDHVLSREELIAALVPSRPEKHLEEQEPATLPGANAVRYLLLAMDENRNARIEKSEVPSNLRAAYEAMSQRLDRNENGALERLELSRGGPAMSAVAMRYVARLGIDVDAELAKFKKLQGEAFDRFEQQPAPLQNLKDSQQAKELFAQFDENADGKLSVPEAPQPLRQPLERMVRLGDRDGDGALSEAEFISAAEQTAKLVERRQANEQPKRDLKTVRKAAKAKSVQPKN